MLISLTVVTLFSMRLFPMYYLKLVLLIHTMICCNFCALSAPSISNLVKINVFMDSREYGVVINSFFCVITILWDMMWDFLLFIFLSFCIKLINPFIAFIRLVPLTRYTMIALYISAYIFTCTIGNMYYIKY